MLSRGTVWTDSGVQCLVCMVKDNRRETRVEMKRPGADGGSEEAQIDQGFQ